MYFYFKISYNFNITSRKGLGMLDFLKRRLQSEKGAMDKILVTLLLVIIGVGAVVGLSTWMGEQSETMKTGAKTNIDKAITDSSTTTTE